MGKVPQGDCRLNYKVDPKICAMSRVMSFELIRRAQVLGGRWKYKDGEIDREVPPSTKQPLTSFLKLQLLPRYSQRLSLKFQLSTSRTLRMHFSIILSILGASTAVYGLATPRSIPGKWSAHIMVRVQRAEFSRRRR